MEINYTTAYRTVKVDGCTIFYREAGPTDGPAILFLHGLCQMVILEAGHFALDEAKDQIAGEMLSFLESVFRPGIIS